MKMAKSLLNKKLPRFCEYCAFGTASTYNNEVFCKKKGIVSKKDSCFKYKYDPLKRIPNEVKIADGYNPEDFKL